MYDIYDVLHYDHFVSEELNKQVFKMYQIPYKIYDDDIEDYVLVSDVFADEIYAIKNDLDLTEDTVDSQKLNDYLIIKSMKMKEFKNVEITIDSASADISILGRTFDVSNKEDEMGISIKRNFVWVSGAEDIPGCIKQNTGVKDKFSYTYENEDGSIEIVELQQYEEGMSRPYYTQDDKYTYMWLDHFSGGSGTQTDPYIVSTRQDFMDIINDLDAYYSQSNDIEIGSFDPTDTTAFTYYENVFEGFYYGNDYSLYNATYDDGGVATGNEIHATLFPSCDGAWFNKVVVSDMNIDMADDGSATVFYLCDAALITYLVVKNSNISISGSGFASTFYQFVGTFLGTGRLWYCEIYECSFNASSGDPTEIGGTASAIAYKVRGDDYNSFKFDDCYVFDCTVTASSFVSAMFNYFEGYSSLSLGLPFDGELNDMYVLDVELNITYTGTNSTYSAGFANSMRYIKNMDMNNLYFSVSRTGGNPDSAFEYIDIDVNVEGTEFSSSGTRNVYYDNVLWDDSGSDSLYFTGKTTEEMQTQSTYEGFDFEEDWVMAENVGIGIYPDLTAAPRPDTIKYPTDVKGYLRLGDYYIPYYDFSDFESAPFLIYKNYLGDIYGFIEDSGSPVRIGSTGIQALV